MPAKVLACLLLATLIATSLSRAMYKAHKMTSRLSKLGPVGTPRNTSGGLVRREWPGDLSQDQKHLISQFLPHIYAEELAGKGSYLQNNAHLAHDYWMDFGRRSSEDLDGAA